MTKRAMAQFFVCHNARCGGSFVLRSNGNLLGQNTLHVMEKEIYTIRAWVMIYTRNALLFLLAEQFILRAGCVYSLSQSIMRLYIQLPRICVRDT